MSAVISIRVPRELKEEAKQLGLNIREIVERSLREAIEAEKKRRIAESLKMLNEAFGDETVNEWVEAVRKSRKRALR